MVKDDTVGAAQRNAYRLPLRLGCHQAAVGTGPEGGRSVTGVEWGCQFGGGGSFELGNQLVHEISCELGMSNLAILSYLERGFNVKSQRPCVALRARSSIGLRTV